jgi:hypothetical protein
MLSDLLHQVRDTIDVTMAVVEVMAIGAIAHAVVPFGAFVSLVIATLIWARVLP